MPQQIGARGEALVAVYCSSKAAVISLTQSAGLDLIKHGINVNAIAPGVVDNEHWDDVDARFARYEGLQPGDKKRAVGAAVPFGRMARPEEIAGLAVLGCALVGGANGPQQPRAALWYLRLRKPGYTPPGPAVGAAWGVLAPRLAFSG